MNKKIKLLTCKIKWFYKLKVLQRIKKYTWCQIFCGKKNRCYPRVDIADEKEFRKHWHCRKCFPCGIVFDYIIETSEGNKR